jgi:riboflavin biosynthesis pyrimidine reductase
VQGRRGVTFRGRARSELASEIAQLKRQPGNDLLAWGGAAFAQSLSGLGLVDEYRLIVQPVALGSALGNSARRDLATSRRRRRDAAGS